MMNVEIELDPKPSLHKVAEIMSAVQAEIYGAINKFPAMNTPHEGYAVLLEEVDELWEHVKVKCGHRNLKQMRSEAIQVAAMAIRFAVDVGDEQRGQK